MKECNQNTQYLLVKAKGGMGNCMLCAVSGILYGQLTKRKTVIDWRGTGYTNDGSNPFATYFHCPENYPEAVLPDAYTVLPPIWNGQINESMDDMFMRYDPSKHTSLRIHRKYSVDVRRLNYAEDVVVFWYYTGRIKVLQNNVRRKLPGYHGLDQLQIIRKVLTEQMVLQQDIQERIDDFVKRQWSDNVIGVHIRYTDRKTDLKRYRKALDTYLNQFPDAYIFLATDNLQVSQEYHKNYKHIISTPKWFPEEGSTMHQNQSCTDKVANGIEALMDMYLLAKCQGLIYSGYSTFSLISRILSVASRKYITDIDAFNAKVHVKRWIREMLS